MFADVKAEIGERVFGIQSLLQATFHVGSPRASVVLRGLAFVHMYSVYEYTVINSVKEAILEIKSHGMPIGAIRLELLSLVLDPEFSSAESCGAERLWPSRLRLLKRIASADPVTTPDAAFPDSGTHFRQTQLEIIWDIFGLSSSIVPDGRLFPLINEMVEHRNAVAHGRDSAEKVGSRYSERTVLEKVTHCYALCLHIANELESHCKLPANLSR